MADRIPSFQLFYDRQYVADIPMNRSTFTVGRKAGSNLRLMEASISREHCRFVIEKDGTIFVEDLSSTNGMLINQSRVVKTKVNPNDVVSIGRLSLVLHELRSTDFQRPSAGLWNTFRRKSRPIPFSQPYGKYVLPQTDVMTEFDSVSYLMTEAQTKHDGSKSPAATYLKEIPRLQVVAQKSRTDGEVTRFEVAESALAGERAPKLKLKRSELQVFAQPASRASMVRIPWKTIERVMIPSVIAVGLFFVGRFFLGFRIDSEFARAERHWNQRLAKVAESLQYADDRAFLSDAPEVTRTSLRSRRTPLSTDEVFRRIDSHLSLRNFLLFEILDDFLSSDQMKLSLEEAIKRLSQVQSLTSRLPSVKKLHVVLSMENMPFKLEGLTNGKLLILTDSASKPTDQKTYAEFRADMTPRMESISGCSGVRSTSTVGAVVLAFTVGEKGTVSAVFINKARSSNERPLWDCVEKKLKAIDFGPPPGGPISVVYSFSFAGKQKVTF